MRKSYVQNNFAPNIEKMEKILAENNGGNGYFVGDDVS